MRRWGEEQQPEQNQNQQQQQQRRSSYIIDIMKKRKEDRRTDEFEYFIDTCLKPCWKHLVLDPFMILPSHVKKIGWGLFVLSIVLLMGTTYSEWKNYPSCFTLLPLSISTPTTPTLLQDFLARVSFSSSSTSSAKEKLKSLHYLHIPKTGTSFIVALRNYLDSCIEKDYSCNDVWGGGFWQTNSLDKQVTTASPFPFSLSLFISLLSFLFSFLLLSLLLPLLSSPLSSSVLTIFCLLSLLLPLTFIFLPFSSILPSLSRTTLSSTKLTKTRTVVALYLPVLPSPFTSLGILTGLFLFPPSLLSSLLLLLLPLLLSM
jgi:hypothetical protein